MYKAGFVAFGEVNTPREVIEEKTVEAMQLLKENGFELVTTGSVTDDERGLEAQRAISDLKKEEFDFLIVCITGWIPSHTVIRVISEFKEKPMVLWGLAGKWINGGKKLATTAGQAGTTALRKPMEDMGYRFKYVYDIPGSESNIQSIITFAKALRRYDKEARSI